MADRVTRGRRVASITEIERPGDYFGPSTDNTGMASGMYTVESAGFRGAPGLVVLKAAAQVLLRGDTDGHSDDGWHGYLDEGHLWRQA